VKNIHVSKKTGSNKNKINFLKMHFFFDKSKIILYKFKIRSVFKHFLHEGGAERERR
jgi:hypothetical protein